MKLSKLQQNFCIWFGITMCACLLDQLTKDWARHKLIFNESVQVIAGILNWRLLYNTGAAFSSLEGQTRILALLSLVVSIILIVYSVQSLKEAKVLKTTYLSFLLAGAMGNLIDRFMFGRVTDFIDLLILPGNFPVFNVADVCINIAVFLFVFEYLSSRVKK